MNLKWRAKFQIHQLHIRDSDYLNFLHFSGYEYKIRLVSILRKREDQLLILISAILKFSVQFACVAPDLNRLYNCYPWTIVATIWIGPAFACRPDTALYKKFALIFLIGCTYIYGDILVRAINKTYLHDKIEENKKWIKVFP